MLVHVAGAQQGIMGHLHMGDAVDESVCQISECKCKCKDSGDLLSSLQLFFKSTQQQHTSTHSLIHFHALTLFTLWVLGNLQRKSFPSGHRGSSQLSLNKAVKVLFEVLWLSVSYQCQHKISKIYTPENHKKSFLCPAKLGI